MYAIELHNISKTYRFYSKPSDRLKEALFRKKLHQTYESLKDISFSVPAGDTLGIIGENGAGKSTLLKILAGTLTPSSGNFAARGRVAALLELGAGFHPEFTGRQNIYLNASLMGLNQSEIRKMEDSIIAFAELGIFIDRPIKIYSSGMSVRLAFSIATSVDPDILIIDEALSVGDQYFQKKCIDRMLSFRERGKTIVFCSHAMYTVNMLCSRAVWLENGTIRMTGLTSHVIAAYENFLRAKSSASEEKNKTAAETAPPPVYIRKIALNEQEDRLSLKYKENLSIMIEYESSQDRPFFLAVGIRRNDELICHAVSMKKDNITPIQRKGVGQVRFDYFSLPFFHGEYAVVVHILDETGFHCYHSKESAPFSIVPPEKWQNEIGLLDLVHEWKIL